MAAAVERTSTGRGPRITVQLDRAHNEFLKLHRRQYGLAASWIVRRLIENQMATGKDLLGKPLGTNRPRKSRRSRPTPTIVPDTDPDFPSPA